MKKYKLILFYFVVIPSGIISFAAEQPISGLSSLICLISILFFTYGPNYEQSEIDTYRTNYLKCLNSKDKSGATYWGERYYESINNNTYTIHQQNQIQLKIQNDILSHLK